MLLTLLKSGAAPSGISGSLTKTLATAQVSASGGVGPAFKIKVHGVWEPAKAWIKVNGQWQVAQPRFKTNGDWQ
jgi:hypothetical protein